MAEEDINVQMKKTPENCNEGDEPNSVSDESTDSDEMTKKQRFKRWFSNNFTNQRHEEAMKQTKMKRMNSEQEFAYYNDVILQMLRRVREIKTDEQIMAIFQEFDANGDGVISEDEMAVVIERLLHMKLQGIEFRKFYAKIDTDHDGSIQYQEFVHWITGDL